MKKTLVVMGLTLLAVIVIAACGGESTGAPAYVEPAMEGFTVAETTSELVTESALQTSESESAAQTEAATSFSAGTTTQKAAKSTMQKATAAQIAPAAAPPVTTSTTARPVTAAQTTTATTTQRTTTTTTAPPQTQPPKPVYTEADYAEIIAAVRKYAEAKTAIRFIWNPELRYDGPVGFHDVVNLSLYGKAFVISELKYHCDLTETLALGGNGGVPSTEGHFNVVCFEYQGNVMFVFLYG